MSEGIKFSKIFKEALVAKHLSMAEFSRMAEIPRTTAHSWVSGHRNPRPNAFFSISKILDIPIEDIEKSLPKNKKEKIGKDVELSVDDLDLFRKICESVGGKINLKILLDVLAQKKLNKDPVTT